MSLTIAIVCYSSLGGSGMVARDLAVGLACRGHRVFLLASSPPSRALPDHERLSYRHVPVASHPVFEHAPYTLALASSLIELAGQHPLDIIHSHYAVPHAVSAYLAAQALGPRAPATVATLHGTDVTGIGAEPSYAPVTRFAVRAADAITVPSNYLRERALAWLDTPDTQASENGACARPEHAAIEVVPNFVDTEAFAPPAARDRKQLHALFRGRVAEDAPVLIHVSNFRAVKRARDLLEVLTRVRGAVDARLLVVGDGPDRPEVEAQAAAMGLAEHVRFLGKQAQFASLLGHADAFLLPSETESFGLAALEALSCGVPVLGYRVGGLPDVVTQDVGVLVTPFDVDALSAATTELLRQPTRRAQLASNARARVVQSFQRAPAIERYEGVFAHALERLRGRNAR